MVQYIGYKKMKITEEHLAAVRKLEDAWYYFESFLYETEEVKAWWGLTTKTVNKHLLNTIIKDCYRKYIGVFDIGDSFYFPPSLMYKEYVEYVIKYVPTNVGEEIEIALEYAKVLDELLEDYLEGRL